MKTIAAIAVLLVVASGCAADSQAGTSDAQAGADALDVLKDRRERADVIGPPLGVKRRAQLHRRTAAGVGVDEELTRDREQDQRLAWRDVYTSQSAADARQPLRRARTSAVGRGCVFARSCRLVDCKSACFSF
jgi:hypothetical protein